MLFLFGYLFLLLESVHSQQQGLGGGGVPTFTISSVRNGQVIPDLGLFYQLSNPFATIINQIPQMYNVAFSQPICVEYADLNQCKPIGGMNFCSNTNAKLSSGCTPPGGPQGILFLDLVPGQSYTLFFQIPIPGQGQQQVQSRTLQPQQQ